MKRNYKKYFATVAIIWLPCIVIFAIAYMLIVRPQSEKRVDIKQQVSEAKRLCEAAEAATLEKTQSDLNIQIDRLREKIRDYVVDEKDFANLTFAISKIASEKNVTEFSIHTADSPADVSNTSGQIYEKHMAVDFAAGFNQFAGFLNALERYQPVIFVNDFHITRSADKPTGHKVSMNLVVLVRKAVE